MVVSVGLDCSCAEFFRSGLVLLTLVTTFGFCNLYVHSLGLLQLVRSLTNTSCVTAGNSNGPLPATSPPISLPYADMTLQVRIVKELCLLVVNHSS